MVVTGSTQTNVGLYVLVTLGAVACISSMFSVCLILNRRRKRHQEKTNDEEEIEKEKKTKPPRDKSSLRRHQTNM